MTEKLTSEQPMRVIYLEAQNFKTLKAVRITPSGERVVRIEGKNGAGKTTVIDIVAACAGGGKWQAKESVRRGEREAYAEMGLGTEPGASNIVLHRSWKANGSTKLKVMMEGAEQASPQTIVDRFFDDLCFDPVAFIRMKPQQQAEVLRTLAGLDFTEHDLKRDELYRQRTDANRIAKLADAQIGTPVARPDPPNMIEITALTTDHQKAMDHNLSCSRLREQAGQWATEIARRQQQLEEARQVVKKLEESVAYAQRAHAKVQEQLGDMAPIEIKDLTSQIDEAQRHNTQIEQYAQQKARIDEARDKRHAAEKLDDEVKRMDAAKDKAIREARMPVAGLAFDLDGVRFNGLPFEQASSAEQLRVSVAIGLARKPLARIMGIRDGSLLDIQSLNLLDQIAEEHDAQVFVERVAEGPTPGAVYIEDGEVVESQG